MTAWSDNLAFQPDAGQDDIGTRRLPDDAERLVLLDATSVLLANAFDVATVYDDAADLLVPAMADLAVLIQITNGERRVLAMRHANNEQDAAWSRMQIDALALAQRTLDWQHAVEAPEPILFEYGDDTTDTISPHRDTYHTALGSFAPRSSIVAPMYVRGRLRGVLALVLTASGRRYEPADVQFALMLARRIGLFIDNNTIFRDEQRAREAAERSAWRTSQLQTVATALGRAMTREEVAAELVHHTAVALQADGALVVSRTDDGGFLELLGSVGYDPDQMERWKRFSISLDVPICDAVLMGMPVWLPNRDAMITRYRHFNNVKTEHQALGAVPLLSEGRSIGAIGLSFRDPQTWHEQDQALVYAIAQLCAQALERARLYDAERRARIEAEQEISRRHSAETALLQSQDQLRVLTDSLPVLISYVDRDERYRFTNKTYEDWFGVPLGDTNGKHVSEVIGPRTYEAVRHYIERALAGEQFTYETMLPFSDGSMWPVQGTYVPHFDEDGSVLGYYALISDNSERKRREESQRFLSEATSVLASSLDYETTLAHVGELAVPRIADWCSINLLDDSGSFVRVSGVHVDPRKQQLADEIRQTQPPDLESESSVATTLRVGEPLLVRTITDATLRVIAENEEQYEAYRAIGYSSMMILPLRSSDRLLGSLILAVSEGTRTYDDDDFVLAKNLANRAAIAIENARLFRRVQETVRIRDEFLSIAAHELKTPITSLSGYAQLLQQRLVSGYVVDERDRRALAVINNQTERLTKLVGVMLDVARIERGHFMLDLGRLNLSDLVNDTLDELRPTLVHHTFDDIQIASRVILDGDEQRLQQVILNLLQNAIKYSPGGGNVGVTLRREEGWAVLVVSDQGIGIPVNAQSSLFQRFYRAPNAVQSSISGVGLGLFVVREIVTRHGGSIEVVSREGRGATFIVRLPALPLF